MKAVVKDIVKETHSRDEGATPVVVFDVDFVKDSGELHGNQRYAFTLDQLPLPDNYWEQQAHSLQLDADVPQQRAVEQAAVSAANKPVDDMVGQLRRHHKLSFDEAIPINEKHRSM